jgi:hypothetical protein
LLPNDWIRRFQSVSMTRTGFNVRGSSKGWTEAIIKAALERYESLYDTLPLCMVGVFDHKNYELFWRAFDRLHPGKQMSDFDEQTRANIGAQCIRSTHFWRPREAHGYTLLRFEVDALAEKQVLVRAYRNGLSEEVIRGVETSVKIHDHLKEYRNWKLGHHTEPR